MAVTATSKTTAGTGSVTSAQSVASQTFTSGKLYLLTVTARRADGTDPSAPTMGGTGTWTQVVHFSPFYTSGGQRYGVTMFRFLGDGSTGSPTVDYGGVGHFLSWVLDELTGIDTGGTNGSAAIVQTATATDGGTFVTTITATLAAFGDAGNATYASLGSAFTRGAMVANTWTIVSNEDGGSTEVYTVSEFKASNDTSVDMTWTSNSTVGMIAAEIKAVSAGVSDPRPPTLIVGASEAAQRASRY